MLTFPPIALLAVASTSCTPPTLHSIPPKSLSSMPHLTPASPHTPPSILPYLTHHEPAHACEEELSYWGDTIHRPPDELHRVYFQNLDGLRNDNEEIDLYVESMLHYQVGTFCWTDPSLDFLQPTAKSKLQTHTLAHFKTALLKLDAVPLELKHITVI